MDTKREMDMETIGIVEETFHSIENHALSLNREVLLLARAVESRNPERVLAALNVVKANVAQLAQVVGATPERP